MTDTERNSTQCTSSVGERRLLTRRRFLAASGVIALSGCLSGEDTGSPDTEVEGPVANAPIPDDPRSFTYARTGSADRPTVTYYGNWKCPYCADFSTGFLGDIITDYVEPGDVNLQFRALAYIDGEPFLGPDAPRAAQAGLAAWNVGPETYWRYHEYVFANQPPESATWATTDKLVSFAEEAGVPETGQLRTKIQEQAYESPIRETSQAAADAGVSGTPALVIDGETVNPLSDEQRTRTLIEQLADGS
ncbi:thioredoxin domain-containing protein [Halobaculum sp. WSA2]|uniref:Thioredoxin domain-containing protein n=1 Tax=Halobaculum saliterrae TaxID=2073113 RepID=A0A6B0SWV8_9EURY|nr:DsbA family protein [Halobaculum saliterrae]MXR43067.1 thioredoxin domain-containing protein [Halobaculum saliterrae]